MADFLKRFNQTVAGSRTEISDYISVIGVTGDFKRVEGIQTILNSWNNILVTPKRSYIFDPEYGSDLYKLVFEPADETTKEKIREEVIDTIEKYDNRAAIKNVTINFLPNRKGFQVNINVSYKGSLTQLEIIVDQNTYFKFFETVQE